jgi:hypothetical protein
VQVEHNLDAALPDQRLHQGPERAGAFFRDPTVDVDDRHVTDTPFVHGHTLILARPAAVGSEKVDRPHSARDREAR